MPEILLGVIILFLLLWAGKAFSKADPKQAARVLRAMFGGATLLFAGFMLFRGEIGVAIPVGAFGLGLLGWGSFWPATFGARTQKSARPVFPGPHGIPRHGTRSRQRHDARPSTCRAVSGRFARLPSTGRRCSDLFGEIDSDSRELLAAYLDRREPGWREHAQGDAGAGGGARPSSSGKMTEEEAYQILGIQPGASAEEVSRAHRSLMKKLHPDQGGTTYLAARVNEAKDVLLRRHR